MSNSSADPQDLQNFADGIAAYTVDARCYNCGWKGQLKIRQGMLRGDFERATPCTRCGCKQLNTMPRAPGFWHGF